TNTRDTTKTTTNTQTTNEDTKTITKTNEKSLKTATFERTANNYQDILNILNTGPYSANDIVRITLNPGTYTATQQIEIDQWKNVKQLVINGNGQTIDANGMSVFKTSGSGPITIANLTLTNGAGNYLITAGWTGELTVDNCTFTNNNANYVIFAEDNNAAKLVVRNSTFEGNSGTLIYAKTLNAQITGNTFKNNDLGTGHVINGQSGVFNISKNVFHNNSANNQTCIILDELVTKADINNNTFTNNNAVDLAAVLYMSNEVTTSNHTFTNNIILNNSAERGTVFGVNKAKNNIQISDNIIEYNTGMRKGVIVDVINGGTIFVLENNTIKYNYLPDGAVRDEDEDCLFYAMSGNLTLIGNDISENIGYGTSCMFNVDGTFCLFNNTISRNHFEGSSIIYMNPYGESDPHIYLDHNTFDSNEIFETDEYHPYIINVRTHKDTGELRWYGHLVVTNNTFNNNTVIPLDSQTNTYEDILLSQLDDDPYNVRNHFIADNNYTNNALNTTNATITRNSSNATHYNITAEVYVLDYAYFPEHPELGVVTLDRYNTTVRNGTMRVTDKNGNFIGDFPVVNGTSEIILDKNEIAPLTAEDLVVTFISDYKHYQNYRGHILSVNADPKIQQQGKLVRIYGQYESYENGLQVQITGGDPNIAQRVSLYRSEDGQPGELVARYIDVSSGSAVVTISATLDEVNNYTGLEFIALYDNIEHEPLTAQAIGATNNAANQTVTMRIGSEVFSNTTDKNGYYEYWRRTTSIGEKVVHTYTPTDSATTTYYVTRARLNATAVPAVDRLNDKVMIYGYLDYVANFTYHVNVAGVNLRDNPYLNVTLFGGENDEGEGELLVSNVDIKENEFDLTVYVCNHDMQKYMKDPTSLTVRFTCNDTNAVITPTLVSNYSANNSLVTVKVYDREYTVTTDDEGY
ncbi:MAG: right-handed parallel beta-helix repeat-containing protein, partial [Thermoplasmata archaeon]|nr:right-handed parallel beta-helix repeat-containing protein [Thermoplasmata archaeon]